MSDPADPRTVGGERLRNLEEAVTTAKRAREALTEVEEALRVRAALKQGRESRKERLKALRTEIMLLQGVGPASAPRGVAEQRLRSITPVTQPIVLCSQIQRSGGTLLARLFDGHPACFAHPSELAWGRLQRQVWPRIDLSIASDPDALLVQLDEGWPKRFANEGYHKFSKGTENRESQETPRYPFVFDLALQRQIFASVLARHESPSRRDVLNAYLTSLFNAWLDYQNLYRTPKQWVTAFQPRVLMDGGVEPFFSDYPDGLLVTIVREPGAWLSSFSRHRGREDSGQLLDVWLESTDASLRAYKARPQSVVVLLFEDLVHNTAAVMRLLSERMGIAFGDVLLEPTYNSMPVLSDSSHVPTTAIDPDVTARHRHALPAPDLELVAGRATPRYADVREEFALRQAV